MARIFLAAIFFSFFVMGNRERQIIDPVALNVHSTFTLSDTIRKLVVLDNREEKKGIYKSVQNINRKSTLATMPVPEGEEPQTRQPSRVAANEAETQLAGAKQSDLYTTHKGGQGELTGSEPYKPPAEEPKK